MSDFTSRDRKGVGLSSHNRESGFALLFVYAMAATVAIMLYMELPRVAFEAQRDKEQLLIDRGEQYSRAINLYVRKFNRYPADFDALASTQNMRFLRHKYIDPMTGKDDWRIVHVGPGGVFTDSLVYGKKKTDKTATEQQNFITELQQTGGNQNGAAQAGVNIGTRQRQSDQPGAPGDPNNFNNPGQPPLIDANGQPFQNPLNGVGGAQPPNPNGAMVQPFPNNNGFPNNTGGLQLPPGVQFPPGFPQPTNQPIQGAPPGQLFPTGQQNPAQSNVSPPTAANLINQILTTPRPGGLNGLGGQQQATVDQNGNPVPANNGFGGASTGFPAGGLSAPNTGTALPAMQGQTIGGGIAGVASKIQQDGIKTYKDRTPYNEWEFVYDITKDPLRGGGGAAPTAAPAQNAAPASPFAPTTASPTPPPPPPPPTPGMTNPQ